MNSDTKAIVTQLLYDNIASLPHEEYGVINMVPFAHDSEQVNVIKRHICEAIVNLLDNNGYLRQDEVADRPPEVCQSIATKCLQCGNTLVELTVKDGGVSSINARNFIAGIAALNPECPHNVLGLEDMRRHMEQEFWNHTCKRCNASSEVNSDGLCNDCEKVSQ